MIYLYIKRGYDKNKHLTTIFKKCLDDYFVKTQCNPPKDMEIVRTKYGKPFFKDESIHFSISHSKDIWICAFSDLVVGADVEKLHKINFLRIAKRFFLPNEYAYAEKGGLSAFLDIWTKKESYLKYTGYGLAKPMNSFDTLNPKDVHYEKISIDSLYILSICSESKQEVILVNI